MTLINSNLSAFGDVSTQEKIDWIRLTRSENIGRSLFFNLIKIFGSVQEALDKVVDFAKQGGLGRSIKLCEKVEAEKELNETTKFGAEILIFNEKKYPRLLREIPDPPPLITVKGRQELFDCDSIAVVGPRNASFNGIAFAKKISQDLSQNSIVTVSGLARGVDAAAHKAAIDFGTIAVIAGGIDHIYPKENEELYHRISKLGLLVSETAFGAPPKGGNFVQRNRLISGLSLGVIVVEAGAKSGSLITARYASEQGREVFAVPGSPLDPRSHGTNRLIKDGARMLETIDDVLEDFIGLRARFSDVGKLREPEVEEFIAPPSKMPSDDDIKKVREEILSRLNFTPIAVVDIIEHLQMPARLINIALVQLELADKIEINFDKINLKNF